MPYKYDLYSGTLAAGSSNGRTRLQCIARFESTDAYADFAFDWIATAHAKDEDGMPPWLFTRFTDSGLLLWNVETRRALPVKINFPKTHLVASRLSESNCLVVGGKDWSDVPGASLARVQAQLKSDGSLTLTARQMGIKGVFDTNHRNFDLLIDRSLENLGGGLIAVGTEVANSNGKSINSYDHHVELLRIDTLERVARVPTRSNSFVRLLPQYQVSREKGTSNDLLLVVGHWNGSLQIFGLGGLAQGNAPKLLQEAFVQEQQPFGVDGHFFDPDKAR